MKITRSALLKELRSWVLPLGIFALVYFSGWLPEVMGFAQRMVLKTGIMTAKVDSSPGKVPDEAWTMRMVDMNGNIISLSDLKGKVVFLNQWATWCPPCVAEMPSIQSLYENLDPQKVAFVMLSLDDSPDKARKFVERKQFTFPTYYPQGRIPQFFVSSSIPTTWVISADGFLVSKKTGMADYSNTAFRQFMEKEMEKVESTSTRQ